MVERIRDLLNRFPLDEEWVRELIRNDPAFDALCQRYQEVGDELQRQKRKSDGHARVDVEDLRKRRSWLEEELLTRIQGYEPA